MSLRSFLFVPGDSERKLARGLSSGADALILDLEDSVAPARKALAQGMVTAALAARAAGGPQLWVRINPMDAGGLDGMMLDMPHLTQAQRLLARHAAFAR